MEQMVSCQFTTDAKGLGYLDEHGQEDLKEGSTVEVPYWAAKVLAKNRLVQVQVPPYFGEQFKRNLLADPKVVNLSERCDVFYSFGLHVAQEYVYDTICVLYRS